MPARHWDEKGRSVIQDLKYQDIYNIYDFKTTKLYYEAQKDGIKLAKKIIKENNIKCDLTKTDSITFTTSEKEVTKFDNEKKILDKLSVKYYVTSKDLNTKDIKS